MSFVRSWFVSLAALVAVMITAAGINAAPIFFSTVGPPSGNPAGVPDPSVVPSLTLDPSVNGGQGTLHIWIKPDGVRNVAGQTTQVFASVAYDIDSSNPGAVTRLTHTVANPVDVDNDPATRWDGINNGTANATGSDWVINAFGTSLSSKGVGNSTAGNTQFVSDPEYHAASRSFYLGTLTFQAAAGASGQTTRLYFRTGSTLNVLKGGSTVPITFGNSTTQYVDDSNSLGGQGDLITDAAAADAILMVTGGIIQTGAPIQVLGAPASDGDVRLLSPIQREFRSAGNRTSGRLNISNFHGQTSGDLDVFFDLVDNGQAQALVNELNAAAAGAYTAALSNFSGVNRDTNAPATADIVIRYAGRGFAGSSQYIDFNFGAGREVAAVGVPEPSSWALASLGVVGLVAAYRRRKQS